MEQPLTNNPPDMAELASDTTRNISGWLSENPVIQSEESAREAKLLLDRGKLCIADLEDERKNKTRPLNEQVEEINNHYRPSRTALEAIVKEISRRLSSFIEAEEAKRREAAEAARRLADEAERVANEYATQEQEAIRSVNLGELGVDIAAYVVQTEDAYRAADSAAHKAAIVERESQVKIGGGFKRSASLKTKETLVLIDAIAAITEIGITEDIREAVLKSARTYRKLRGRLPAGVSSETRREV